MKKLFTEKDITKIGYFQSILENAGIPTDLRNEHVSAAAVPIADLFPTLYVRNDDDYERAIELLRHRIAADSKDSDTEVSCQKCEEINPGNFEICWSCGETINTDSAA